MKKFFLWITALFFAANVFAQEGSKGIQFMDNASWGKVVKDAKEQNKLIFVDCYTTWCGPCKRLAAEVFPREDLGTYVNERFVSVKYDVERGNGLEFAKQYRDLIHGFPTLLLIDTEGKVLNRIVGFFPAETILKAIQNSVEGRTWQVMEQEYQAGKRDRDFVMEYLEALLTADEGEKYDKVKREYIAQFPLDSLMNKEIWELASGYITNPESDEFQFVLAHLNDFANRGFDRYDLEWTLAIQTYYVISDIVSKGFKISSQDTIKQMQERLQFLDTMLQAKVKNFPEYLVYVRVEESFLARDYQVLLKRVLAYGELGLLDNLKWTKYWIDCLVENLDSSEQIRLCVDYLYELQKIEEKDNDWVIENCYGIIAKGYAKLGEQSKADEYYKVSEELDKQNEEKLSIF